jgi:hypothetical protein
MKFVYIRWVDACSHNSGWVTYEDAVKWADGTQYLAETSGWVIRENKRYILLAQQRGDWTLDDPTYQYANLMRIPKTWIKLRVDLTKHI